MVRLVLASLFLLASVPSLTLANDGEHLHVHPIAVVPFAALLLSIAILPLVAGHFWHSNLRKLIIAGAISAPILVYLLLLGPIGWHRLEESLIEYIQFILLLGSLYTVSGGILLEGDLRPSAKVNVAFLLGGAVLANFIGTTGASMLLIRPFLKINAVRYAKGHLPVFFIFLVSNLGGLLTPLGDPPLFLGFLRGVSFFWTASLWMHWLVAVGSVAAIFFVWDTLAFRREPKHELENLPGVGPIRVLGKRNFLYLAGILAVILLHSESVSGSVGLPQMAFPWSCLFLLAFSLLSLWTTPKPVRKENEFSWGAIIEVAVLFIGIFITMVPALAILEVEGHRLGVETAWQYFWATGFLSSFLDNAPTYVSFATLAAGGKDFAPLMTEQPLILQAISAGAVFMGAVTYIGNGPNFMVKAIADESGYPTPSFFGYMLYSTMILVPVFLLITFLFFV